MRCTSDRVVKLVQILTDKFGCVNILFTQLDRMYLTYYINLDKDIVYELVINPLTLELNPSAQRCLKRFFTGDFAS
jgi:hypothetical protein